MHQLSMLIPPQASTYPRWCQCPRWKLLGGRPYCVCGCKFLTLTPGFSLSQKPWTISWPLSRRLETQSRGFSVEWDSHRISTLTSAPSLQGLKTNCALIDHIGQENRMTAKLTLRSVLQPPSTVFVER